MAIQLISVGLSVMESLRNPARRMQNGPGLADVVSRERPDELLLRAGTGRNLAAASVWLTAALESPDAGRETVQAPPIRPPLRRLIVSQVEQELSGFDRSGEWLVGTFACGYLVVQARNHGVAGRSLRRAVGVAAFAGGHALMVSLIGLVLVAPAFIPNGRDLSGIWHHPRYGHVGMVLLLATAWCLAVGVSSQILWDDRPITAPLAHLSWRSGG